MPYAFTEHGAIQAANVLNSPRAVEMGIYVVRAFARLRTITRALELEQGSRPAPRSARSAHREEARHPRRCHRRYALGLPTTDEPAGAEAPAHRLHRQLRREAVEPRRAAPTAPATDPRFGPKSSRPSILHSTHRPPLLGRARRPSSCCINLHHFAGASLSCHHKI